MIAPVEVSTSQHSQEEVMSADRKQALELVLSPNFAQAVFEMAKRFEAAADNAIEATDHLLKQKEA